MLAQWKRSRHAPSREFVLELGAHSSSDLEHDSRDFRLEEAYPYLGRGDTDGQMSAYRLREDGRSKENDLMRGWLGPLRCRRHGLRVFESKKRLMEHDRRQSPRTGQRFPQVDIVTGLLLRRQYYRSISVDVLSKLFKESLTRFVWFRHERWQHVDLQHQSQSEQGTGSK